MSSHGVPRVADKKEDYLKEKLKIKEYNDLIHQVHQQFKNNDLSSATLSLVSSILIKNPEYYTIWNYRRKLLLNQLSHDSTSALFATSEELRFLVPLLIKFPKCYWIWNYRLWLLNHAGGITTSEEAVQLWSAELDLVSKMLNRDERNFHGWDYRRQIISQTERLKNISLAKSEFEFTTKMIKKALQNFSALHYRSKLIPRMLKEDNATHVQRVQIFESELNLMQEALIDPFNQSAWFYHSHLMGSLDPMCPLTDKILHQTDVETRKHYYVQEISRIKDILEDFDDCKLIYQSLIQYCLQFQHFSRLDDICDSNDMILWLDQLMKLDPARIGRWNDLKKSLGR